VLLHKEESNQDLYGKALDQIQGEALEVIHLNELIEIDTKHLEGYH
jgi:hypothetical protein